MMTTLKHLGWSAGTDMRTEERSFADVDDSSADSFPASDPPAWASLRVGAPSTTGNGDPAAR